MNSAAVALMDLARNGVTDVMAAEGFNWTQSATKLAPAPNQAVAASSTTTQQTAPKAASTPIFPTPKPAAPLPQVAEVAKSFALEDAVWTVGDATQVQVIFAGDNPNNGAPLSADARTILEGMLKALNLPLEETGYLVLDNSQESTPEAWHDAIADEQAADVKTLVLGDKAAEAVMGKKADLNSAREWAKTNNMCITFHPHILSMQPILKRMAWQDLQAWQAGWESIS